MIFLLFFFISLISIKLSALFSVQIAFLNFKGHNFGLHISLSLRSHIFRANHATDSGYLGGGLRSDIADSGYLYVGLQSDIADSGYLDVSLQSDIADSVPRCGPTVRYR